ncbi:hypothetical protein MF271_10175 [Deinococcus sp. KNUC1210]|uniref:hypothetical protein n=1 Tax=Deinococcus sp. KNUC1210 TaxID=2917691 RepID=UPI001EF0D695|nr:hypothetical protein [Deinococcus sp. KNUC1210]ULH14406.1 hypothetical protein MF271_10175 [Deinococcus sp. KNUC1210]
MKARQPILAAPHGGQFRALGIGDADAQDPATAVDQQRDLAAQLMRQFGQIAGQLRRRDRTGGQTAAVQVAQRLELCGAQAGGIA